MALATGSLLATVSEFVADAHAPDLARQRAANALCDPPGVILAGVIEPAAQIIRSTIESNGDCHVLGTSTRCSAADAALANGDCHVLGTSTRCSAADAALANGVAAHALDYDDMCFVSMAHPSCALVPAVLAAAELSNAPGRTVLTAYVVGFELECRLGAVMNPQHYHSRGWHCTSSIGTVGAAASSCGRS